MGELIKKLRELKRYDITPYYDGVIEEEYDDGEYVRWIDIAQKLLIHSVVVPKGALCYDCKKVKKDTITLCKKCYLNDLSR
jgi:hypothetical protein